MTIQQLKKLIENVPDTHEVYFEYDGPDTYSERPADDVVVYENYIVIVEGVLGQ